MSFPSCANDGAVMIRSSRGEYLAVWDGREWGVRLTSEDLSATDDVWVFGRGTNDDWYHQARTAILVWEANTAQVCFVDSLQREIAVSGVRRAMGVGGKYQTSQGVMVHTTRLPTGAWHAVAIVSRCGTLH